MPRKITIFEPHFHDAQFGPTVNQGPDAETEESTTTTDVTDVETESTGGFGKMKFLALAGIVAIIGGIVYKKFSGEDGLEIEIEELDTEEATTSQ